MYSGDLLTVLTTSMDKKYLSDLHHCNIAELASALESITIEEYTLEEWQYALSYIIGTSVSINSLEQVKPFVKEAAHLQKH